MPRSRVPITFGQGLDRSTGAGVRDVRSLYNARDVVAREAGLELRAGLAGSGLIALDWGTDILAQESVEVTRDILQVIYDRSSRDIRLYRVNPVDPSTRQNVATWGTLHANASFPVVTMAEAGGKVYIAHAETILAYRLDTKYWSPGASDTDAGTLTAASADLDGSGAAANIKFFGVARYREYIMGWGWGTETDAASQDRPEIVRHTKPDDVTVWRGEDYFIIGARGSRVIGGRAMPNGFLCASEYDRYTITGTDPDTFAVQLTDPSHGIVSPRAWQTINGVVYQWSAAGPRVTTDPMQPSEDLAIPLDLAEAVPSDWVARGPTREVFTGYDPNQRVLYFVHPDLTSSQTTTFAYLLSLRAPEAPRFTVGVLGRRVACAGRFISGKITPPAGLAYASAVSAVDDGWFSGTGGRRLTVSWTNNTASGSETVELWLKVDGVWTLKTTVPISGSSQSAQLTGLEALTVYRVGVRHRTSAGAYTSGFTEATPDLWSSGSAAGAKDDVTTSATAPTLTVGGWFRTSSTTTAFTLSGAVTDLRTPLEVSKTLNGGSSWTVVTTFTPPSSPWSYQYDVPGAEEGGTIGFRVRLVRGAETTGYTTALGNDAKKTYVVPGMIAFDVTEAEARTRATLRVAVQLSYLLDATVVQVEEVGGASVQLTVPPAPGSGAETLFAWMPLLQSTLLGGLTGTLNVRVRMGKTAFSVTDWGPWTSPVAVAVSGDPAPITPDGSYFVDPLGNIDLTTNYPLDFYAGFDNGFTYPGQNNIWLLVLRNYARDDAPVVLKFFAYDDVAFTNCSQASPLSFGGSIRAIEVYEITNPPSDPAIMSPALTF